MFWQKPQSHFRRIGLPFVEKYNRPYIELFKVAPKWYGTLHYDPNVCVELTLWDKTVLLRETHTSTESELILKHSQVSDAELPVHFDDLNDALVYKLSQKEDSWITFASGISWK